MRSQCSPGGDAIDDPLPIVVVNKCSVIEIAIGEIVIRAGFEVDEAHLARVIRAVRAHGVRFRPDAASSHRCRYPRQTRAAALPSFGQIAPKI